MSPEKQRIKIAEFVGWTRMYKTSTGICGVDPSGEPEFSIPDYVNDLNAMHEAERVLTPIKFLKYAELLINTMGSHSCIRASAAQRAEAFLRALNMWEESA